MPTCQSCGAPLDRADRFCGRCGAEVPSTSPDPEAGTAAGSSQVAPTGPPRFGTERNWAVLAHLSALAPLLVSLPFTFLGPLVLWLVAADRGDFARDQAAEALNFNLSWLLWIVVLLAVGAVVALPTLGIGLIPVGMLLLVLAVTWLILVIVAAVRASSGERYRYPLTIRFVSAER